MQRKAEILSVVLSCHLRLGRKTGSHLRTLRGLVQISCTFNRKVWSPTDVDTTVRCANKKSAVLNLDARRA